MAAHAAGRAARDTEREIDGRSKVMSPVRRPGLAPVAIVFRIVANFA